MIHALVTESDGTQRLLVSPSVILIREYAENHGLELRVFRPHEITAIRDQEDLPYGCKTTRELRFRSSEDARREIITTLGEFWEEYDIDAICAEAFEWRIDHDDQGNELVHTGGFQLILDDNAYTQLLIKAAR